MDIKNPANIQTKIPAPQNAGQNADGQNTAPDASFNFLIRTMQGDLDALSKNIQPTSLKLEPQIASLTQAPIYQPKNIAETMAPKLAKPPSAPARLADVSARALASEEAFGGVPAERAKQSAPVALNNAAASETKQKQQALNQIYTEAASLLKNQSFDQAIKKSEQIIGDKAAGWWLKYKTKKIVNSAKKKLAKQKATSFKTAAPPITKAAPPASLPIVQEQPKPQTIFPPTPPALTVKPTQPPIPPKPAPPIIPAPNPKPAATPINMPPRPLKDTAPQFQAAKFLATKTILTIGAIILLAGLLAAAGWYLWQNQNNRPVASTSPTPSGSETSTPTPTSSITPTLSPSPSQSPIQKPIFNADKQELIVLKDGQEKTIAQEIANRLTTTDAPKGSFTELLFKSSTKNSFFSLTDLAANLPTGILELTDAKNDRLKNYLDANRFSLLLYSQAPSNPSPFTGESNQNKVVLAVALAAASSQAPADLAGILSKNEPLLLGALAKLLPIDASKITAAKFSSSNYKNTAIRYFNFDALGEISIDYAVLNNILLIGTSKESARAAIDKILAQ